MNALRHLLISLAWLAACGAARAQMPLPQDMLADFPGHKTFAKQMWLPVSVPSDSVLGRISFDNASATKTVSIDWIFTKTGAATRTARQVVDVSFSPTAVARRAGTSTVFYVVGWSERTGRVVVETWTMSQYALGSAMPQGGAVEISTFVPPSITRELEWISDPGSLHPIWDSVCQVHGNDLLMLESGTPTRIWAFDLSSRVLTELYNSNINGYAALAGDRMFSIGKHGTDGLIAIAERRKPWESATAYQEPYTKFVLRDANSDGAFDSATFMSNEAFWALYPVPWDMGYTD